MSIFKKLAGDTLIYGLGTILPRLLNYSVLTIYYTRIFGVANFGILQELYAYAVFIMVMLTFGLETGYFRFTPNESKRNLIYSNGLLFILINSFLFLGVVLFAIQDISHLLKYDANPNYLLWISIIIVLDAITALPFAYLRYNNKALKFSLLKLASVVFNIVLVIGFYYFISKDLNKNTWFAHLLGDDNMGFVLLANIACSLLVLVLLLKEIFKIEIKLFSWKELKVLLVYSIPLVISGLAGMTNETIDKVLMKHTLSEYDLGVYAANYKIAVILLIFLQMYRYAIEPFFFKYFGSADDKKVYAKIMNVFLGIVLTLILGIVYFLDYVKFFIDVTYHEALVIIPIVLIAYLFYGIFFNLSIWYKLSNKTIYGALITLLGAGISVFFNLRLVPQYGYIMAAYGHLASMVVMVIISYILGQIYLPIKYNFIRMGEYLLVFSVLLLFHYQFYRNEIWFHFIQLIIVLLFGIYLLYRENFLMSVVNYAKSKSSK